MNKHVAQKSPGRRRVQAFGCSLSPVKNNEVQQRQVSKNQEIINLTLASNPGCKGNKNMLSASMVISTGMT
jgi:hypothetical protein